jgi:hypothetical protein
MLESTESFRKFAGDKSWQQLDFQTQQQIRLMAILEQATSKYGDEVAQNTNTSMARLSAIIKNITLNIGQGLKPVLDAILPSLISIAQSVEQVTASFAQLMQAIFGTNEEQSKGSKISKTATKTTTGFGKAIEGAGKKAKGALAGFDEINQLQQQMAGGVGTGAEMGMEQTTETISDLGDNISKENPFKKLANDIKEDFKPQLDRLQESFANLGKVWKKLSENETIKGIVDILKEISKESLKKSIDLLAGTLDIFSGSILLLSGLISGDFSTALEGFKIIGKGFRKILISIFGEKMVKKVETWAIDTYKYISSWIKDTKTSFNNWKEDKWDKFWADVGKKWTEFWSELPEKWTEFWSEVGKTFETKKEEIQDKWTEFWSKTEEKWKTFKTGFKTGWSNFWNGVGETFTNIWKGIKSTFVSIMNGMIDLLNIFIKSWNKVKFKIPKIDLPFGGSIGGTTIGVPQIKEFGRLGEGGGGTPSGTGNFLTRSVGEALRGDFSLEELKEAVGGAFGTAILETNQFLKQDAEKQINIEIDGNKVMKAILPRLNNENQRVGSTNVIKVGG